MPDIPIPLVGPSNPGAHVKADSQRSVNLIPYKIEREGEKTRWHLVGAPGNALFSALPYEPIRGRYIFDDRTFVCVSAYILEVYEDGTTHQWGTVPSVDGRVIFAELNKTIIIGDGEGFYSLDLMANTLAIIADAPRGRWCFAFNQRVHYVEMGNDTAPGQIFYSEILDPTNIPGANFYTAENRPDKVRAAIPTEDQIWIGGDDTFEMWQDTGDANTPFQRIPGGVVNNGLSAENTLLQLDNSVWWVGKDSHGEGVVWRSNGFTPVRVSVAAVERFLSGATNLSAFGYQEDGHTYYVLNADEGTWACDIATQNEWHERAWLFEPTGELRRARVEMHAYCYGKHLGFDWENGNIYQMSQDIYDDAGTPLIRKRITGHLDFNGQNVTVDELYVDMATGVGLNDGQGSSPLLMMRYSRDGGQNWSAELHRSIGPIGATQARVRFNRLGAGRDWVFEFKVSDPVQVVLLAATARVRVGRR